MPVGYGYVRSDEPTVVDWGAITKQATESLAAIDSDRKKRKADIEETNREFYKTLADRPVSQNTAFNSFMSDYSTQVSAAMLNLTNQLKSGNITEEDFYRKRANVQSQTEIMLNNFNTYSQKYDEYIQRAGPNGVGASIEGFERSLGKDFMNFENLRPVIDPNSYEVAFTREIEGALGKTQLQAASANDVFQYSNFTRDKFDLDGAIKTTLDRVGIKTYENNLGQLVSGQYIGKTGDVLKESIKKDARAIASQDETVISILTDYGVETTYDFSLLPNEVNNISNIEERNKKIEELQDTNPDVIYRDSNGKYYVSDVQRESAITFVEEQITNASSYKIKDEPFLAEQITRAKLTQLQKNNQLIDAKLTELNYDNDKILKMAGALTNYFEGLTKSNIETALSTASTNPTIDKEGEISRTLTGVLAPFGVTIEQAGGIKQVIEVIVPGQEVPVEIFLRDKSADAIVAEITGALFGLEAAVLDEIYEKRIVKSNSESTETTSNEENAKVENDVDAEGLPLIKN